MASRIEINTINGDVPIRQVGHTDDLFFGNVVPEPATPALLALGELTLARRRR